MMNEVLTNPLPEQRVAGRIIQALVPGWWIVQDSQGRKYRAASSELWRKGDQVVMVGGQIVGRAGTQREPVVYRI